MELSSELEGIAHVLRDSLLQVPPFQRNYSWTDDEVDAFWYDLRAALTADQPYYFMGTIVVSKSGGGRFLVIDGQQRLATTTLLLSAIRDAFETGGEPNRSKTIQDRYLSTTSLLTDRTEPKLELNELDRSFFRSAVLRLNEDAPAEARPALASAYLRVSALLRDEVEAAGPHWVDRLLRWVDFLEQRAQVVLMSTADDGDAFMVFETLNDRGLPLAVADVIKNYLFNLARRRIEDAQESWIAAMQAIEDASTAPEVFRDFIRHWWNSKHGATRERDLYSAIRRTVVSEDNALTATADLATNAPAYAALISSEHLVWEDQSPRSRQAVRVLNELGLDQYKPLALAVLVHMPSAQVEEVLGATVNWSVRTIVSGGLGGGTAERLYSEAAVRVSNGRSLNVQSVYADMEPLISRDSDFAASFAVRRILRSSTLRYLLHAITSADALGAHGTDQLVPIALFPRSDKSGLWANYASDDDLAANYGRIGNYVLLPRAEAKSVSNIPEERFAFLQEMACERHFLPSQQPWRGFALEAVDERQAQMARRAVQLWPALPSGPVL